MSPEPDEDEAVKKIERVNPSQDSSGQEPGSLAVDHRGNGPGVREAEGGRRVRALSLENLNYQIADFQFSFFGAGSALPFHGIGLNGVSQRSILVLFCFVRRFSAVIVSLSHPSLLSITYAYRFSLLCSSP